MIANKFRGEITADGRLIVHLPKGIAPGAVDVIVLRVPSLKPRRRAVSAHPAFGIWAKRSGIADSAAFAAELRRQVETRRDGRD